jgi:uncharacterized BrkB/YihY/UPF0761 family membrane protein
MRLLSLRWTLRTYDMRRVSPAAWASRVRFNHCVGAVDEPPVGTGRVARATAWGKERSARMVAWAEAARGTHASVDVGFRVAERDRQVAAAVLAGGVAYRIFFWLLAVALLAGGALGLVGSEGVEDALDDQDVGATLTAAVGDAVQSSQAARWWLIVLGSWLLLWTGYMAAKALVLVHAAVWGVPPRRISPLRSSLVFTTGALTFLAAMAGARWLRNESEGVGLGATLLIVVIPFVFWLAATRRLPHRGDSRRDLVAGALLVALGVEGLHLFTALYLGPKLTSATELYGGVGIATTALFWLYVVGRLVVGAATLNAALVDRSKARRGG